MSSELLYVADLQKAFGGITVLKGVSLSVAAGEVVGLIGPNGSGKTTCINVLSGVYHKDGGVVRFLGKDLDRARGYERVRLGLNRNFQTPRPFRSLTVEQNVSVAARLGRYRGRSEDVSRLLEANGLAAVARRLPDELTSAQQKMLDLVRALATRPKLLCVDELGAGLTDQELVDIGRRLRDIAASGVGLIVVEHLMSFVRQVTDRVVVLSDGRNIFDGALADAESDQGVVESFLGKSDGRRHRT